MFSVPRCSNMLSILCVAPDVRPATIALHGPPPFAACSLVTACIRNRVSPFGGFKSLMSYLDNWRRAFFLSRFSCFKASVTCVLNLFLSSHLEMVTFSIDTFFTGSIFSRNLLLYASATACQESQRYTVTSPVLGLLLPCSHTATHTSLQTSHPFPLLPPPHIHPTTETSHLPRLAGVHYNC